MSETISLSSVEFPSFLLLAAITRAKVLETHPETLRGRPLEVTFFVNGIELPFSDTVNDLWRRARAEIDKKVEAAVAKRLATIDPAPLMSSLSEVQDRMAEVMAVLAGMSTPEPTSEASTALTWHGHDTAATKVPKRAN